MDILPSKRKSVPVEHFCADVVVIAPKRQRAPKCNSTDTEPVVNQVAEVQRKPKGRAKKAVVDVLSSDSEESYRELPKAAPVRKQVVATAEPCTVQQEEDKMMLMESKLIALQQENDRLKQKALEEDKTIVPQNKVAMSRPKPDTALVLSHDHNTVSSMAQAPMNGFAETWKKLYLDNIGLRTEADIFESEAREHFRARKRAEGRLAQAEASAMFDSLMQRINK